MRVVSADSESGLARCVDGQGGEADVEIALVGPVAAGDALLVHAGVALMALAGDEAAA